MSHRRDRSKPLNVLASGLLAVGLSHAPAMAADQNAPPAASSAEQFVASQKALGKKPNLLINEKSPYLLKHAFNPVDWRPWGDEAFALAKQLDRPIFLSIGYATCHWCNVMEEESFDNPETAAIMNQWFVNVKVDREERPDVDRLYLAATIELTGSGGWPMTLFLSHEGKPFYAGTYFPPKPRFGKPGLPELLDAIHRVWQEDRQSLLIQADQAISSIRSQQRSQTPDADASQAANPFPLAMEQFSARYDATWGGFGSSQKFPRTMALSLLLRLRLDDPEKEEKAREMALLTLRRIAAGGLRDHLGGGFHRYAVDRSWRTPHFEKMLYDQAQLAVAYLEAWQISREAVFKHAAEDALDYVLSRMTGPEGGFYSAEDADSQRPDRPGERGEGAFYIWRQSEIMRLLDVKAGKIFCHRYGITENGNAQTDPLKEFTGHNILYEAETVEQTASRFGITIDETEKILADAKKILFKARDSRPRPYLDDKRTAAQNGLAISAFARAGATWGRDDYLRAAGKAAEFIESSLMDQKTGDLFRRFRDNEAGLAAQLADYAFVVQGLLDLHAATQASRWLDLALRLNEKGYGLFVDPETGDLFETAASSTMPLRLKANYEDAEPSGVSVATLNYLKIGKMLGADEWLLRAEKILAAHGQEMAASPATVPQMLVAQDFARARVKQIVIAGNIGDAAAEKMLAHARSRFMPRAIMLLADSGANQKYLAAKLPVLGDMGMINNQATAYVCENFTCQLPTTDFATFAKSLE